MKEEIDSLMKKKTYALIKKPEKKKTVSCKWIFKIKEGILGTKPRWFKARLVARVSLKGKELTLIKSSL